MTDDEAEANSTLDGETDEPTDDESDESTVEDGRVNGESQQTADGGMNGQNGYGDETVPHVELDLYELSVRVSGQSTDGLEDVEA
ncbi:hypothetical protein, partial [Halorubrum sp. Atlit-28R]